MANKLSGLQFEILRLLRNGVGLVQLLEQYLENAGFWFIDVRLARNLRKLEKMKLIEAPEGDRRRCGLTSLGRKVLQKESMKKSK
jgi:hypothetical protein